MNNRLYQILFLHIQFTINFLMIMTKSSFVAICFLCLVFSSVSLVQTAIPLVIQAATVAAKTGIPLAIQAATVAAQAGVVAGTTATTATGTAFTAKAIAVASSILKGAGAFISAHPYSIAAGVVAGVGVSASAAVYQSYSVGASASLNETHCVFVEKMRKGKIITQVEFYSSPVEAISAEHHELIFQINDLIWTLISFGIDGLEIRLGTQKQRLIGRRTNNTLVDFRRKTNIPTQKVLQFIKEHQGKNYTLMSWNCQHFSKGLWDQMVN